jgi:uncharacterized membrane protein
VRPRGYGSRMKLDYMPYTLVFGVIVVSFATMLIVGVDDGWLVPVIVLPVAALYLVYDRRMKKRREAR